MIKIEKLKKSYGDFVAVDTISFSVKDGEVCSFLGVNGAGKTTTLKILAGVLKPTAGTVEICGIDISVDPRAAKRAIGYIPDRPHLHAKLTGREFLYFVSDLYDLSNEIAENRIDALLTEYRLRAWEDKLIESYSHGMKQRLATCAALLHEPRVLIVDEPMVGLDPHGAKLMKQLFRSYAKRGMSILVSTHSLNIAEEISDHIVIINRGQIIADGTLPEIKEREAAQDSNLEEIFLQLTLESDSQYS